jgi:hypothetical protein
MINKDFTLYPEALELKQLGFDEPCFTFYQVEYHENSPIMVDDNDQYRITGFRTCKNSEIPSHYISCPTYSQAFRWFREKHKLISGVRTYFNIDFFYEIYVSVSHEITSDSYNTYEEAEQACLKEMIKIVKEKQK